MYCKEEIWLHVLLVYDLVAYSFFFFVGDKLIYLDPHFCQDAVDVSDRNFPVHVSKYTSTLNATSRASQVMYQVL